VQTEEAVLMRMNLAPRSVAENLGMEFRLNLGQQAAKANVTQAREFIKGLGISDWDHLKPSGAHMSGTDYKNIWELLSGEQR
jgi:hypothetical protein